MMNTSRFSVVLSLIFGVIGFVGILHHELWLDESHHWLLARDSTSFSELLVNSRLEGHPLLWNILLYIITRFTSNPFWMQFTHLCIAITAVFIFLKRAPFPLLAKFFFILGYFFIYEYTVISRNYMPGILFLFLACDEFRKKEVNYKWIYVYLAIATNVHLIFAVITLALFLTLLVKKMTHWIDFTLTNFIRERWIYLAGLLILGIQLATSQSSWVFDTFDGLPWTEKIVKGFIALLKGLIPIPDFRTIHFWNTNIFIELSKPFAVVIGLLLYALPFILFKNKFSRLYVYMALAGTQIFFFVTQRGASRFDGVTYLIFITAIWIDHYWENDKYNTPSVRKWPVYKKLIIYSVLIFQLIGGGIAFYKDYRYPFTPSKQVGDFIATHHLTDYDVVTFLCEGTIIGPYIKRKPFFLCENRYQSFCPWNTACNVTSSITEIIQLLNLYAKQKEHFLFISSTNLMQGSYPIDYKIKMLATFDNCILSKTNYYLFELYK